jgi:glycosyltransferase involved in cell wall biosynthesis
MSEEEDTKLLQSDTSLLDIDDADDLFVKPVKKRKILMLSDHQLAPSGVGVQARFLIEGLIKTGKYSFRCLGGAIKHQKYEPIAVSEDFIVKPVDGFGTKEMIRELLVTEKPDALFLFTDPRQFTWLWEMEDEIHQVCPILYWHVWDNDPFPKFNAPWYQSCDLINCLSQKTYDLVKPHFSEKTNYIPHAFPKEVFYPMPKEQIEQLKAENFGDRKDWFKVLWVNRNATRKMPADVMASWSMFLINLEKKYGHRNAVLIMHTDPKDREGPDLLAVAEALNLQNHVWFSAQKLDFPKLNILHNLTDSLVNVAKNEGFGLSTLISMQCGKPVIALCTGGETSKVVDPRDESEHGVAIRPAIRTLVGSQQVPYIFEDYASHEDTAKAFMKIHDMTEEEKDVMRTKVTKYVDYAFNHDVIVKQWDETMDATITKFKEGLHAGNNWDLTALNPAPVEPPTEEEQKAENIAAVKKIASGLKTQPVKRKVRAAATKKKKSKPKSKPRKKKAASSKGKK